MAQTRFACKISSDSVKGAGLGVGAQVSSCNATVLTGELTHLLASFKNTRVPCRCITVGAGDASGDKSP